MKDNPIDRDSPLWTAEDFAAARPADEILPPHLAELLIRDQPISLRQALSKQPRLARGLRLAA